MLNREREMPHFFINSSQVNQDYITISNPDLVKHLVNVLRVRKNESILFIDQNQCQYNTLVIEVRKNFLNVKIIEKHKCDRKLNFEVSILSSILNNTTSQNYIIQKATELGCSNIYCFHSDNCSVKRDIIEKKVQTKWRKVAFEASQQCQRAIIPKVEFVNSDLEIFLEKALKEFDLVMVFSEKERSLTLSKFFKSEYNVKKSKVLCVVGPEGGFSEKEFEIFDKLNIKQLSLGKMILRADTAVVVILANLIYALNYEG